METVQVSCRVIYGKQRFYPENPIGEKLAKLMKLQTFWLSDLEQMKELGFKIEIVSVSLEKFAKAEKKKKAKTKEGKTE